MEYRGVADVLTAEERLRERREGAVIVTVVQSGLAEVATATRLVIREDGAVEGTFGIASETKLVADALERLGTGRSGLGSYDMVDGCLEAAPLQRGHLDVFFEVLSRPPELVIVGAGHIAVPLARIGALLGFDVVVLDDRPEYASRERFPDAHRI